MRTQVLILCMMGLLSVSEVTAKGGFFSSIVTKIKAKKEAKKAAKMAD